MRTTTRLLPIALFGATASSCASSVTHGALSESSMSAASIAAVDSATPPRSVDVQLERDAWLVLLLVAPGHSATLLYPTDSLTSNKLNAGTHHLEFKVPEHLVVTESAKAADNAKAREDYDSAARRRARNRTTGFSPPPLTPATPTYLLVVSSPHRLTYARVIDKTAGVSIPTLDHEALSAVGKAVKSTLSSQEQREWAGYFYQISVVQPD